VCIHSELLVHGSRTVYTRRRSQVKHAKWGQRCIAKRVKIRQNLTLLSCKA
jgi:hypothetical protein